MSEKGMDVARELIDWAVGSAIKGTKATSMNEAYRLKGQAEAFLMSAVAVGGATYEETFEAFRAAFIKKDRRAAEKYFEK